MAAFLHPARAKSQLVFVAIAVLLALLLLVLFNFASSGISYEQARVFIEAISIVATLSLLYFAYISVLSSHAKDIAAAELAVRPVFIWKISSAGRQMLHYRTIKHPIYDLEISLEMHGKKLGLFERHLDVSGTNGQEPEYEKSRDMTSFVKAALAERKQGKIFIMLSYHSEVGGRYEAYFSKEIRAGQKGMQLLDRKILWAKYPWREEKVYFD
ncbi:hypothetical protein J4441_04965 [Candidatus Micrarchaeota archaeon]|nr:hypothetical protein [Candidatus Micrarchaeota archaeon]